VSTPRRGGRQLPGSGVVVDVVVIDVVVFVEETVVV